jgi:hypothetical protein
VAVIPVRVLVPPVAVNCPLTFWLVLVLLVVVLLIEEALVPFNVVMVARVLKRSVEVAAVVVALSLVSATSVEDADARSPALKVWREFHVLVVVVAGKPTTAPLMARSTPESAPTVRLPVERFVVVAFVDVLLVEERYWMVEEAVETRPAVYALSALQVFAEVVAAKYPFAAARARAEVKY